MQAFENRFRFHISQGLQLERALDIGAYRGDFSKLINRLWPGIKVWQFEADERQKPRNPDAYYILLGDQPGERDFYTVDEKDAYTTGSSIYRETTEFYRDPIILKKKMTTLDRIMRRVDFSGNWKEHGLVKLDTQGSEVDILKGARNFLETFTPRLILLETSVFRYNLGAPLIAGVFAFMRSIGYRPIDVFDLQYEGGGNLNQMDVLFELDSSQPPGG